MIKLSLVLLSASAAGTFALCDVCQPSAASAVPSASASVPASTINTTPPESLTVTLHIEGMTCGGCTLATRKVLQRLDGVRKAEVSYEEKTAVVTYDPARVTVAQIIAAVATLKYSATVIKT